LSKKKRRPQKSRARSLPAPAAPPASDKAVLRAQKKGEAPREATRKRRLILAGVIIVVAAALFLLLRPGGRSRVERDSRLNILLITMDTTRADRLGCYGYTRGKTPNLDALAQKGVRFENVYAQVPLTLPSHCSIMTGTYPVYHNVHNNGTYSLGADQVTLAKVLKENGLKTAAFVASFSVDSRFGLNQGFDVYDDIFQPGLPFKPPNSERKAEQVFASFSSWLGKNSAEHFFAWVHFFDPHLPYDPPSPYNEQFADIPYDGEIAYMDFYIGAVIKKLEEKGVLGRTLVILAGDHGEAFGEKVESGHGVFLYDQTMKVPLIFYSESHLPKGKVFKGRVRLIDIMPTILDMLNLPKPATNQGTSLVPYIQGRKKSDLESLIETFYPKENYGWSELTGLVAEDWKYIRAPKPELYNLKSDRAEDKNVFASAPKIAADMSRRFETLLKKSAGIAGAAGRALTAEDEERLRSLGYTNFSSSGAKSSNPDPKDELDVLRLRQDAEAYEYQGKYAEAAAANEKLLALIPDSPAVYVSLALSQARQQKFDEAIQTLIKGTERIPGSEILLSRLGYTYLVTARFKEAFETMTEVLKINPRNVDALTVSAGVMETLRNKEAARGFYEQALAIDPKSRYLRMSYAANLASGGKIDEAIKVYGQLVEDYPNDAVLYQYLGIAYGVSGDYVKSVESLKQAVYIRPTPTAYFNLSVAYKKMGDIAGAVRYLRLYLEDPKGESEINIRNAQAELQNLERTIQK
jgi:arylsulfatase A-like enzyme/Flp pilus assembly protein TadD